MDGHYNKVSAAVIMLELLEQILMNELHGEPYETPSGRLYKMQQYAQ
jgi:hypothetical protein